VLEQGDSLTGIAAAREGVAALRAYAWVIVVLAVGGALLGYLIHDSASGSEYRAWITARPLGANSSVTDLGVSTPDGPQAADFLGKGVIVRLEAATGQSYDYLTKHLELSQPPNGGPNPPIALIAKAGSGPAARDLVSTWLAAIHQARLRYVNDFVSRGKRALQKQLDRAIAQKDSGTEKAIVDLLGRMEVLNATLTVDYSITHIPRPFVAPPVSRAKSAAIGGVAGLLAGLALALVLALIGGRVRTAEGIEVAFGCEVLADLRSPRGIPSKEHARERLRSLRNGELPSVLPLVPCGSLPAGSITELSTALGEGIEARATEPIGQPGLLNELREADTWAVVVSPGGVRRAEVAAFRVEIAGISAPAGLLVV
jgi:hypothetical protein